MRPGYRCPCCAHLARAEDAALCAACWATIAPHERRAFGRSAQKRTPAAIARLVARARRAQHPAVTP